MKIWPFNATESRGYSDVLLDTLVAAAEGTTTPTPLSGAAIEIAAGLWQRAFQMADGGEPYFTPALMGQIARQLARHGEVVLLIEPESQRLRLAIPEDVQGGPIATDWVYQIELIGPTTNTKQTVSASRVIHVRYAYALNTPWKGMSPLDYARSTGTISAQLERVLGEEASATVGYVLPVPQEPKADDAAQNPLQKLQNQLAALKGKLALVRSQSTFGEANGQRTQEWTARRLGASPPRELVELRYQATASLLAVYGVSPAIMGLSQGGTGIAPAGQREAWRQFLHATVQPIARLIEHEASLKLGKDIRFGFDRLFASDLQGRARAFQSMVAGGMDATKAAALSGLMVGDDDA